MFPGFAVDLVERFLGGHSVSDLFFVQHEGGRIPELVEPFFSKVPHADGLPLVEEHDAWQEKVDACHQRAAVKVDLVFWNKALHGAGEIVVFQIVAEQSPSVDHRLFLEQEFFDLVHHCDRMILPLCGVDVEDGVAEVEDGREITVFSDVFFECLRREPLVDLADRHGVMALEGVFFELVQKDTDPLRVGKAGKAVCKAVRAVRGKVRTGKVFFQMADGVDAETADTQVEPSVHHRIDLLAQGGIFPVQVRLPLGEEVEVVAVGAADALPRAAAKDRAPVVGGTFVLSLPDDIIFSVFPVGILQRPLKPGMFG